MGGKMLITATKAHLKITSYQALTNAEDYLWRINRLYMLMSVLRCQD